jgi:shikimate kinase
VTPARNLVLIGMPGCGKSTVGVLAAKALGLDFADTDLLLQRREGLRLPELLAAAGPEGFLAAENGLLAQLNLESTLISTGGSAVYHEQGMSHLKKSGTVVWLDVPFAELERRLGDIHSRGVVLAAGQTLRGLHDQRRPLYQRWADATLAVDREDLEVTVGRLAAWYRSQAEQR